MAWIKALLRRLAPPKRKPLLRIHGLPPREILRLVPKDPPSK